MKESYSREEVKQIWYAARDTMYRTIKGDMEHQTFEDWEKSKEQVYPEGILSLTYGENSDFSFENTNNVSYQNWIDTHLFRGHQKAKIKSVRNSAGELLTVGDMVEWSRGPERLFKINGFHINDNNGIVADVDINDVHDVVYINSLHPAPKKETPKTEDGYDIKPDGATYYKVNNVFQLCEYTRVNSESILENLMHEGKVFYRKGNAEKYIDLNKPRFSKQQIINAIIDASDSFVVQSGSKADTDILKQKLQL